LLWRQIARWFRRPVGRAGDTVFPNTALLRSCPYGDLSPLALQLPVPRALLLAHVVPLLLSDFSVCVACSVLDVAG
jgi:hypothetical protein